MPTKNDAKIAPSEPALEDGDELMDTKQVASMLGISPNVLRDYRTRPKDKWRSPPYHKLSNGRVVYKLSEYFLWMDARNG